MNELKPKYPSKLFKTDRMVQQEIDNLLTELRNNATIGLHLGCGPTRIDKLINCDYYNTSKADIIIDSTNLSCIEDDTIDLIEHHHMIEHLSFSQAEMALKEWWRVLKPGGLLIFTCPDMNAVLRLWFRSRHYWKYNSVIKMIYGSQEHDGMFHKSGYTKKYVKEFLERNNLSLEYCFTPYPNRPTPSLIAISRKPKSSR